MLSRDLPLFTYNNDEMAYLKVVKLMKRNIEYYDASRIAFMGKFGSHVVAGDVWGWRLPTIFEIWRFIPGSGIGIYLLYLTLACGMLYSAFFIGKRYLGENMAILPAYLLFPYLHFAARDQILLLTEWWAMPFVIFALLFFVKKRNFLAILALSLAVLIREVYIVPIFLIFAFYASRFNKKAIIFLIPLVSFLTIYLYHIVALSSYIDSWHMIFSTRTVSSGTSFLNETLAFGSWEYVFYKYRVFLIFLVLAVLALFYIYRRISREEAIIWLISALSLPVLFVKFGVGPYHDYWGIMYMPIVLILAPIATGNFIQKSKIQKP